MRFLRAAIIGGLCFFPATIIGYIFWLILGASNDIYSFDVIFACNLIPIFGMILGFAWAWKNGEEYGVNLEEKTHIQNINYNTVTNISDSAIVTENIVKIEKE